MAEGMYRVGIVGAGSLLGKELADELEGSLLAASDFVLLGDEAAAGQIASVAEEPAVIRAIELDSFERMDFAFFAGSAEETRETWQSAQKAGAGIVDMTFALEGEKGVPVRAPLVWQGVKSGRQGIDLTTPAVVAAHPAAVMLALVAARLAAKLPVRFVAATVFEPASQHGREAMDELHQQTINLLSFHDLPKTQYDAQVAFNLLPALGDDAKVELRAAAQRITSHYAGIGALPELSLELVQGPVFHGYTASVLVELGEDASLSQVEAALSGEGVDVVAEESDPPSNLSAAGQEDIMVRVRSAGGRRFWMWMAADNLKLAALNAIACALELRKLRPSGKVQ
jgi:aspartate-semialdehyde dehydrogenase